jgi:hypothetical protein
MEFAQLSTFVVAYNLHFPTYNIDKKIGYSVDF